MSTVMVENKPLSPGPVEAGQVGNNAGSLNSGGLNLTSGEGNVSPGHQSTSGHDSIYKIEGPIEKEICKESVIIKDKDRPTLTEAELTTASKEQLLSMYHQLQKYIDGQQQKHCDEVTQFRNSEEKLRHQQLDASRRENVLVMRLTMKEHEMQEYAAQLNELKSMMVPSTGALRSTLLDPAVNLLILRMKKELEDTKKKLEDTQNDLNAWKFTPDSNTGKRLMAKCRMLYQENEELGKMITSGRLAKLETDLALQKSLTEEMRKAQAEMDDVVQELDEDIDGMQSTICFWQEQLKQHQLQNVDIDPAQVMPTRSRHTHSPSAAAVNLVNEHNKHKDADNVKETTKADEATHNESMDTSSDPLPGDRTSTSTNANNLDSLSEHLSGSEVRRTNDVSVNDSPVKENNSVQCNNSAPSLNTSSSMDGISEGDDDDET